MIGDDVDAGVDVDVDVDVDAGVDVGVGVGVQTPGLRNGVTLRVGSSHL